jgi:hypothetical protein
VVFVLLGAGLGFTAANAVPATKAGDGTGAISGYTAAKIQYALNAGNPQNIDGVTLTLGYAPAAGSTMKAQLTNGGPWYSCTSAGNSVTCPTTSPQATAVGASMLTVVIAD